MRGMGKLKNNGEVDEKIHCPFCGKMNSMVVYIPNSYGVGLSEAYVECQSCSARGPAVLKDYGKRKMVRMAIAYWNSRKERVDKLIKSFTEELMDKLARNTRIGRKACECIIEDIMEWAEEYKGGSE